MNSAVQEGTVTVVPQLRAFPWAGDAPALTSGARIPPGGRLLLAYQALALPGRETPPDRPGLAADYLKSRTMRTTGNALPLGRMAFNFATVRNPARS